MIDQIEMTARHARGLAELSELGLSLARDLHGCALAEPEPKAKADAALAFHRISRSVRQSMALEAKLVRDLKRQEQEVRAETAPHDEARRHARKARVAAEVERLIWTEAEDDETAERVVEKLSGRLDEEVLLEGFGSDPIEAHIARLRADLGLDGEAEPPVAATPPVWRSSG